MLNVHFNYEPEADHFSFLKNLLADNITLTAGADLPSPADYQILVAGRPSQEALTTSPNLHTLLIPFAGMPQTTRDLMLGFPQIAVHNLHHNAPIVAETIMMLMLTAAKNILQMDTQIRNNDWSARYEPTRAVMLRGKTALILGYGEIGHRVAELCWAFAMEVLATKRTVTPDMADFIYPSSRLHDLLPRADFLIITLPQTPETEGMIGETELNLLPEKAILINVGRAAVVDEEAFYHALKDGTLYAAGVDVWYNYPPNKEARKNTPPANFPFHELPNIVMMPHRGGTTDESEFYRMRALAEVLNVAAAGKPMPHRVDVERGY